jgi:zinc transporter ZupT
MEARNLKRFLLFVAGFAAGIAVMVYDELLTLSQYCGAQCRYQIPLIGTWTLYQSSYLAFALVVLAGIMTYVGAKD